LTAPSTLTKRQGPKSKLSTVALVEALEFPVLDRECVDLFYTPPA